MPDKTQQPSFNSILGPLSGKTINRLQAYIHGSTEVVELGFSDSTVFFIKFQQRQIETGGTNEWNTGTKR
jgi:hypothetical protein